MTRDRLLALLKARVGYQMPASKIAKLAGVSQSYLSEVLSGKKQMSEKIINYLGYKTVIIKK